MKLVSWGAASLALLWAAPVQAEDIAAPGPRSGPLPEAPAKPQTEPLAQAKPQTQPGLLYSALGADDSWTIRGTFRARIEGVAGEYRPRVDPAETLLTLQTRVYVEKKVGALRFGAELLDTRGYLEDDNTAVGTGDVNAGEMVQAFVGVDLGDALGKDSKSLLKVGRFTQSLGSMRWVANNEGFPNVENVFTGAYLDWRNKTDSARIFWAMPNIRQPSDTAGILDNRILWDRQNLDTQFFGAFYSKGGVLGGALELYGYGLMERDQPKLQTRNRRLFTPGFRLIRLPAKGKWDYELEGTYQTGTVRATTAVSDRRDLDVDAFFVHATVGHTFALDWKPRVLVQYDYASGDRRNPDTWNRFDGLYGARRFDITPLGLYGALWRANLSSPEVRVEASPTKRWETSLALRGVWRASATDGFSGLDIRDPSGTRGRFAGTQWEGRTRWWVVPKLLRMDAGFAYLHKSAFLRRAPNVLDDSDTRYGYADLTFAF